MVEPALPPVVEPALPPVVEIVLDLIDAIPAGQVSTYGDLAELAGTGPRQVGRVMSHYGSAVAWWRVIRADGRPAPGHTEQALALLEADGTPLRGGRVDLARARWAGPAPAGGG